MKKNIVSAFTCAAMLISSFVGIQPAAMAAEVKKPAYQSTARQMEDLNRGLIAVKTEKDTREQTVDGVYLSWRLLGTEILENQAFDIYRNDTKIYTTGSHDATNYIDTSGKVTDTYKVVKAGASATAVAAETAVTPWENNYYAKTNEVGSGNSLKNSFTYIDIPISRPDDVARMGDGKTSYYYTYDSKHEGGANDASVGDLDGDGDYEIVLKWDPTDSKDSAGADYTGNVYIDAYEIDPNNDGYMWRIDLGQNVTAGAHYTQFMVYDFDGDGKSEIAMKTAPGSKDGQGNYVTAVGDNATIRNADNEKSYIGTSGASKGKNLGPEYLTVFDGETGKALATTDFIPLGTSKEWGDDDYNRAERFLAGVAYLDGVHPSIIMCRGYYAKAVVRAYSWDGETLGLTWEYVGSSSGANSLYGQGNHNLSIGDIDNDGKDEIVYGSAALDDDGETVLGNTQLGHGDAMHMSDFNNDGSQEVFSVKEEKTGYTKYAADLRVAETGEHFWDSGKIVTAGDNGRGVMDNIDDEYASTHENALALGWDSGHDKVHDLNGDDIGAKPSTAGSGSFDNFLVYWDGDLGRELLDDNIIQKYYADTGTTKRFYGPKDGYTLTGSTTNNYTKRTPSLVADIWGDWREEIIMPVGKGKDETPYLRIFTSTISTDYRLTTLMHDSQYRMSVAWQNVAYNQPTHTSYYIGSAALATDDSGNKLNYLAPAVPYTLVDVGSIDVPVTGISLQETAEVEKGKKTTLSAVIEPSDASKKSVTWTSSDTSVATVSNGIVTGIKEGSATITAVTKDGGFAASCKVTVYSVHATGITISKSKIEIGQNGSEKLSVDFEPADTTDKSVTWTSSDTSIATVSNDGTVKGVKQGRAVITAKAVDGGYTATCSVKVFPLTTTDQTGEDLFVTTNTDDETTLTATATSAAFAQKLATTGGEFHKSFTPYSDNKATLSFKFTTGGQKIDGIKWNWTGHEYTFGLKFLDTEGNNILTLSQAYTTGVQSTMYKIGANDAAKISGNWSNTVSAGEEPLTRSSTRWIVTMDFDYDEDTCTVTLEGAASDWTAGSGKIYTKTFDLNGASFSELQYYTTKDGEGGITVSPSLADLTYTRTEALIPKDNVAAEKSTDNSITINGVVTDKYESVEVLGVLYDKNDGSMVEIKKQTIKQPVMIDMDTENAKDAKSFEKVNIDFEHNIDDYTLKIFMWDSLTNITPIRKSTNLE